MAFVYYGKCTMLLYLILIQGCVRLCLGGKVMQGFVPSKYTYDSFRAPLEMFECDPNAVTNVLHSIVPPVLDILLPKGQTPYSNVGYGDYYSTPFYIDKAYVDCMANCTATPKCNYIGYNSVTEECRVMSHCYLIKTDTDWVYMQKKFLVKNAILQQYGIEMIINEATNCNPNNLPPVLDIEVRPEHSYEQCFNATVNADLNSLSRMFVLDPFYHCKIYNFKCEIANRLQSNDDGIIFNILQFKSTATFAPSPSPTRFPTNLPTLTPSKMPTKYPTKNPTNVPTDNPTRYPSDNPTPLPSKYPTRAPSKAPTGEVLPIFMPTTSRPSGSPTTEKPSPSPTSRPSKLPTRVPTQTPSSSPTPEKVYTSQNAVASGAGVATGSLVLGAVVFVLRRIVLKTSIRVDDDF